MTSPGATDVLPAVPLHGRFVFLRPIGPEDYRFLRSADLGGELGVRWRFRGSTASPEQWAHSLWQSTLAQYLVIGLEDPTPLGLVAVYQANFQDGYAYLAAERFGAGRRSPLMIFGLAMFIEYVFTCWNFHKLYLEVAEYNFPQFESGVGRLFELEGRLREHLWYGGRRWDELFLALYRASWKEAGARLLAAAQRPPRREPISGCRRERRTLQMAGEATVGWDEFVAAVAGAANVPTDAIDRDTRLLEDLDVDSLALAEIVVVLLVDLEMASLASDLPAREWRHVTISELFDEYVSQEQPPARERYVIHRRP